MNHYRDYDELYETSRTTYGSFKGKSGMKTQDSSLSASRATAQFEKEIYTSAKDKGTLYACRLYRDVKNCSLMDAKKATLKIIDKFKGKQQDNKDIKKVSHDLQDKEAKPVDVPKFVKIVQDIVLDTISKPSGPALAEVETVASLIEGIPPNELRLLFGDFADKLLAFIGRVDIQHPSLAEVNNRTLIKGGTVYNRMAESLELMSVIKSKQMEQIPNILSTYFNDNHRSIEKTMVKPPARLVKDKGQRVTIRRNSQHKDIRLKSIFENGREQSWDTTVGSFEAYCRMGTGFQKEIDYLQSMSRRANDQGLTNQSKALLKDMHLFDGKLSDQYMGFVRIRMVDAALIAAKTCDGQWLHNISSSRKIFIPGSFFNKEFWHSDSTSKSNGDQQVLEDIYDDGYIRVESHSPSRHKASHINLTYTPRAYPLDNFNVPRPKNVTHIIQSLESHADTNGCPLFDNFWVLVPTVTASVNSKEQYEFYIDGKLQSFYDYWDYAIALDRYLIETGQIFPVILGEHINNKACYFVGYWA